MHSAILICGHPGTGKTTLAKRFVKEAEKEYEHVFHLDGDNMRKMWPSLGYSAQERVLNGKYILRVAQKLWAEHGSACVIISAVFPSADVRLSFRNWFEDNMLEIRLTEILKKRDPSYYCVFEESAASTPDLVGLEEAYNYIQERSNG